MMKLLDFATLGIFLLTAASCGISAGAAEKRSREGLSYVCPPHFMRLSYKCYYFSNTTATFQGAYWKCRDMKSNIATIRNNNQDKIIRRTLSDALAPLERWIGANYDWGTQSWKWAVSGRVVHYPGFGDDFPKKKEDLDWHCIILDPSKSYRWSSRSCTEKKHYICQTKIRVVDKTEKRRIQQQYESKINEIPVPDLVTNKAEILSNNIPSLSGNKHNNSTYQHKAHELDNEIGVEDPADFAYERKPIKRQQKPGRSGKNSRKDAAAYYATADAPGGRVRKAPRTRRNKHKLRNNGGGNQRRRKGTMEKMSWKTYYAATQSPGHPRVAVEEFSF